jgi:rhamnulokinase
LVIAPACHDTGSAVAAVPASGHNFAWISSGTWSIMGVNSPDPIINNQTLADNFTNEGGVNNLYRFSKNITGLWLVQQCRRTWNAAGGDFSYASLTELAAHSPRHIAVIDPDSDDFLKPGDMPSRIRSYCKKTGQREPTTEGAVVRLALEGLALKYRWVLEKIETLTKTKIDRIHIIGGGTQNRLLSQFTADATRREVITGPIEATAIGNILTQAIAAGDIYSQDEARQVINNSFEPETFEPGDISGWDDAYGKLQELIA